MNIPKPSPPKRKAVHPSHVMRTLKGGEKVCLECDRCTCHRPMGVSLVCPAKEVHHH